MSSGTLSPDSNSKPATFVEPTLPARPIIKPVNFGASGGKSITPTSYSRTAPPHPRTRACPIVDGSVEWIQPASISGTMITST
ncbi:uncharacterized protein BKA78DRAFT_300879 [Phyllosticta capitalensis]|uniref:uncharacterized protein n=1 Tax=Phyllosticta capitalensis TaxID=121624 RepID=UPI0031309259